MKFKPSVLLSFLTGRFYCTTKETPTKFFGSLSTWLSGQSQTISLSIVQEDFSDHIRGCLPYELNKQINEWQHSDDWRERIADLDEAWGEIEIWKPNSK